MKGNKEVFKLSIKDFSSQGGWSLSIAKQGGVSSDAKVQTFCYKKLKIFLKLWCVCTRLGQGG